MAIAVYEKREQLVDNNTGELLLDTTSFEEVNRGISEPPYMKVYLEDLGAFKRLTAGEVKILVYVAATVTYEGEIFLPMVIRRRIAESADCKVQSVTNAIHTFLAAGILKRVESTIFALNPDYFAKGAWRVIREQRKAFQSITTYYPNGAKKTLTQIVETNEEPSLIDENVTEELQTVSETEAEVEPQTPSD